MTTIAIAVYRLLDLLSWIIVIKSLLTWFPNETTQRIYNTLSIVTSPIEEPIRNIMYKYTNGPVDFTPMISIILIMVLKNILVLAMI